MTCSSAMQRKIDNGEAIDISNYPKVGDDYLITETFVDDIDYCISVQNQWVWSIGKRKSDGAILAARTSKYANHPDFECVWLR